MNKATPTFDVSKPVRCRCGNEARILSVSANTRCVGALQPICFEYKDADGDWHLASACLSGSFYGNSAEHRLDLVNFPERKTFWLNIYSGGAVEHKSREDADRDSCSTRLACVEVTYTPGQGL